MALSTALRNLVVSLWQGAETDPNGQAIERLENCADFGGVRVKVIVRRYFTETPRRIVIDIRER